MWPIRLNVLLAVEDVRRERALSEVALKLTHILLPGLSRIDGGVVARHHCQIATLPYLFNSDDTHRAISFVSGFWT